MKLITVIIPVYNVKSYLSKCIESVKKQSYKNLEIILVDDGSDDGSFSICKEFSKKDSRIKLYRTENLGLSHARNVGLDHTSGEYIVFVDSDDYIYEDMVKTMISKSENADLVICNYEKISDSNEKVPQDAKLLKDDIWNFKQFWERYYFDGLNVFCCVAWNKLYKRKLFEGLRYPVGKIHEDEYIINDIIRRCDQIKVINDSLYYYVQRKGSIMHRSYKGYFEGAEALLNRCELFEKFGLTKVLKENLNCIPSELIMGLDETKCQKNAKLRYSFLRKKYVFFLKKYLKKEFSIKLYLKKYMLMMPTFYSLYAKYKLRKLG